MSAARVVPITPKVQPTLDVEREMLEFLAMKLREYVDEHGAPFSVAMVIVGQDHGAAQTVAVSWAPGNEDSSRLHTCSVAAMVLTKRALGL